MSDQVIEPSEIITGREERSSPVHVNPWLRLFARGFDYLLFFAMIYSINPSLLQITALQVIPLKFFAWIPIEALLLFTWGTTPGKWLLKTQLYQGHKGRLPFDVAIRRSFSVYLKGIGLGIVILNLLCMLSAFHRLKLLGSTSWDLAERIAVVHRPLPLWRFYLIAGFVIVGFGAQSFLA